MTTETKNKNMNFVIRTEENLLSVLTAKVQTTSHRGVSYSQEIAIVATIGDKPVPVFLTPDQAKELVTALNSTIQQLEDEEQLRAELVFPSLYEKAKAKGIRDFCRLATALHVDVLLSLFKDAVLSDNREFLGEALRRADKPVQLKYEQQVKRLYERLKSEEKYEVLQAIFPCPF